MLDYIMKLASTNANRQLEVLDHTTRNVANFNTTGYKNVRFEQFLTSDGRLDGATRTDFSPGPQMVTRRETDIAIDGFGYLPVTQPDGTVAYTRDGSLTLNSQGYLITQRGDIVGDGIQLPANYQKIKIYPDGKVEITTTKNEPAQVVGQISVVRFNNPEGLKSIGGNKLVATNNSGEPFADPDSKIKQGVLERSNVNIYSQIDQILRLNAGMVSNLRIIKFADDLYRQSVNLKQ